MQIIVELLFNLFWVVLSAGLIGTWLGSRHRWADHASRPSLRMQIAALAVLVVILFPVVSLTDDLLGCTAPAETEHLVRRDLHDRMESVSPTASIAVGASVYFASGSGLQLKSSLSPTTEIGTPREQFLRTRGNRPPPRT
jgi:hypothetical protein